jgi:exopolyphosphatase / guanosine-5'-triphosphate,3'-diphosphate pyrophosphatase
LRLDLLAGFMAQDAGASMTTIIPRWEWRTFGGDLSGAAARLQASATTGVQASDEVYLLSALGDANVKIRAGLLDIKRLEQVDGDGLEQWLPVLKAEFPLPAEAVIRVFEALGLPAPGLQRPHYSLEQLTAEFIGPEPRLRVLAVHKQRSRFSMGGCGCELTEVLAAGRVVTTLAVESEDPAAVIAVVRDLGLGGIRNQSYPRGLKALIGMTGEVPDAGGPGRRFAVIDLGTNSVKLHVAERDAAGHWTRVLDRSEVTRLGEGLAETGRIAPGAQQRTLVAIQGMVADARRLGAAQVVAVGTMGMRSAANSGDFIAAVRDACGITIDVIGGDEEARLAYLAVQDSLGIPGGLVVVFDTGGGSTQVTLGRDGQVLDRFSLNLGAARLTERFGLAGPVSQETLDAARAAIGGELGRLDSLARPDALVGMGGAVTNLTAVSLALSPYDPERIQGATLTRAEVEGQIARYATLDAEGRRAIPGLQPGRAEVILAGALVVLTLMDMLGQERLSVSDRGLRHGVLIERFRAG